MRTSPVLLLVLAACGTTGPIPLRWGEESCRHCHMTLADPRFGAEIITVHGRVLAYDDAGCAAEAIADGEVALDQVQEVWVIDYGRPDRLISSDSAVFVRSPRLRTPMGSGVAAAAGLEAARELAADLHGTVLEWREVVTAAKGGGLRPR